MKKKVVAIEVVDYVAERGSHKGEKGKYVRLSLENRGSNWIASVNKNEQVLTITRPQRIVDTWLDFAEQVKSGKKIEEAVPDDFRLIDNVFRVSVPLDTKCYRLYRKDEIDKSTGKCLHRKGDIVMLEDGKTPAIYDSLEVLAVKYEDDDTGEMQWLQTPESIVRDMLNRGYYKPVVATASPDTEDVAPEADSTETDASEAKKPKDTGDEPSIEELEAKLKAMRGEK